MTLFYSTILDNRWPISRPFQTGLLSSYKKKELLIQQGQRYFKRPTVNYKTPKAPRISHRRVFLQFLRSPNASTLRNWLAKAFDYRENYSPILEKLLYCLESLKKTSNLYLTSSNSNQLPEKSPNRDDSYVDLDSSNSNQPPEKDPNRNDKYGSSSKKPTNKPSLPVSAADVYDTLTMCDLLNMDEHKCSPQEKVETSSAVKMGFDFINFDTSEYLWFSICFPWLYHDDIGSFTEVCLKDWLNKSSDNISIFKRNFLLYQNWHQSAFQYNSSIEERYVRPTARLIFQKIHLLKLIRIIMPTYQRETWDKFSNKEKFLFSKNLVQSCRKTGSYKMLNAFLSDDNKLLMHYPEEKRFVVMPEGEYIYYGEKPFQNKVFESSFVPLNTSFSVDSSVASQSQNINWLSRLKVTLVFGVYAGYAVVRLWDHSTNSHIHLGRSTENIVTADPRPLYGLRSSLPFAMISGSQVGQSSAIQSFHSRTPLKVNALQGLPLNHSSRNQVMVFMDSKRANSILTKGKTSKIPVIIYWTDTTSKQQNYIEDEWSLELNQTGVDPCWNIKTKHNSLAYASLISTTTLGADFISPIAHSNTLPQKGRFLGSDLIIVDLCNTTSLQWSVSVPYSEKSAVENYVATALGRGLAYLGECKAKLYKGSTLEKTFNQFCKTNNISSSIFNQDLEPKDLKILIDALKKTVTMPSNYQAAHMIPGRGSQNMELHTQSQVTNHTFAEANSSTSYDNLLVNIYNVLKSSDVAELISGNLDYGWELLNKLVNKRIQEEPNKNLLALVLLRDTAHDFYATSRMLLGFDFTEKALLKYETLTTNCHPAMAGCLSILGPKLAMHDVLLKNCQENFNVANQLVTRIKEDLNSKSLHRITDPVLNTQKVPLPEHLDETDAGFEKLNKALNGLDDVLDAIFTTHKTFVKLGATKTILHSILNSHTRNEMDSFFSKSMAHFSSIAQSGGSEKQAISNTPDSLYLKQMHNIGSDTYASLTKIQRELNRIITILEDQKMLFQSKVNKLNLNEQQEKNAADFMLLVEANINGLKSKNQMLFNINGFVNKMFTELSVNSICTNEVLLTKILAVMDKVQNLSLSTEKSTVSKEVQQLAEMLPSFLNQPFFQNTLLEAESVASNGITKTSVFKKKNSQADLLEGVSHNQNPTKVYMIGSGEGSTSSNRVTVTSTEVEKIGGYLTDSPRQQKLGSLPINNSNPTKPRQMSSGNQQNIQNSIQDGRLVTQSTQGLAALSMEEQRAIEYPNRDLQQGENPKETVPKRPRGRPRKEK